MSAILCGKRSFFEDIDPAASSPASASPPSIKRLRCSSSTSPVRFTYTQSVQANPIDQLKALFPDMDIQLLEKALEESGNDVDLAIQSLHKLHIEYFKGSAGSAEGNVTVEQDTPDAVPLQVPQVQKNFPEDGTEWVNLFVTEMSSATSLDDARCRAARLLEGLERTIRSRAGAEAAQNFLKENMMLKEQVEVLLRENSILKRAVAIQHERQKEYEEKDNEVHQLRQVLAQYQEQLRSLELNNYSLSRQLHQAEQQSSNPWRFNPDVF